jgi:predicted dehydrogenase
MGGETAIAQADRPGGDIEDALALVMHFASGAMGSISVAWTPDRHPHVHALDVLGREASIWLRLGPETFDLGGFAGDAEVAASYGDPMRRSAHRFLELARAGDKEAVFCTPQDALATLAVGLACEQALLTGGTVNLPAGDGPER